MKYTFANGNERQKALWKEAVGHLLHMPSTALPLEIEVSFVDPSLLSNSHTTLAETNWTYGSVQSTQKVRNDSPGFGEARLSLLAEAAALGRTFSSETFFLETSIHELGHALFAALPEASRAAIAKMFGAKSDSLSEIAPSDRKWQDRIIEAIAETFKEAFLPRRFRVFGNRTNIHIPYSEYPTFRAFFRDAIPSIKVEEGPEYNLDIFKRGGNLSGLWFDARGGLFSGVRGALAFDSKSSLQATAVEVRGGKHFSFDWTIPKNLFVNIADPEDFFGEAENASLFVSYEAKLGTELFARWRIFVESGWFGSSEWATLEAQPGFQGYTKEAELPGESFRFMWFGRIGSQVGQFPGTAGSLVNAPSLSGGSGNTGMIPPFTAHCAFDAPWPSSEVELLDIKGWIDYGLLQRPEVTYIEILRNSIPAFPFKQGGSGESGQPIILPPSSLKSGDFRGGRRPKLRPVAGSLG